MKDVGQLLGTRVAHDRAVELREARPVDRGSRLALVLVAADERQRVTAARVRDGHAGITRYGDAGRDSGDHLVTNALFVKKERFGATAIEDERIAPFQTG